MTHRPPTRRQLAAAADILRRFAATAELSPEARHTVNYAADLAGLTALAPDPEDEPIRSYRVNPYREIR